MWSSFLKEILENIQKRRFWFWHFEKGKLFNAFFRTRTKKIELNWISRLGPSKLKMFLFFLNKDRLCVYRGIVCAIFNMGYVISKGGGGVGTARRSSLPPEQIPLYTTDSVDELPDLKVLEVVSNFSLYTYIQKRLLLHSVSYCVSKQVWPNLWSNLLYKLCHYFLDI